VTLAISVKSVWSRREGGDAAPVYLQRFEPARNIKPMLDEALNEPGSYATDGLRGIASLLKRRLFIQIHFLG